MADEPCIRQGPSPRRLAAQLEEVVRLLRAAYTDEGVGIWLSSANSNLRGQKPVDLLSRGLGDEVLAEAARVAGVPVPPTPTERNTQ